MQVTFIHHSSFFINQDKVCFLFDYWKGDLPNPIEKPLFIFVSHSHGDHFNPDIFEYGRKWEKVHWILSDDIDLKAIPGDLLKYTTIVSKDKEYCVSIGDISISFTTLRSTDLGVAYLIESFRETFYFAGDLHLWIWREDEKEDLAMKNAFEKEIEKLRGLNITLAFLPLDPRQKQAAFLGLDYIARHANIKRIYPMHCWNQFRIISDLINDPCSIPYRDNICQIRKDGYTDEI